MKFPKCLSESTTEIFLPLKKIGAHWMLNLHYNNSFDLFGLNVMLCELTYFSHIDIICFKHCKEGARRAMSSAYTNAKAYEEPT